MATAQRERCALDLQWLGTAPALMSQAYWESRGFSRATPPAAGASAAAALCERLNDMGDSPKVGRYFEALHELTLASEPGLELLVANRPLRAGGQTLGELDCLYRANGEVIHREVAVKYYLAVADSDDPADWWGPSKRDRLALKLERFVEHQLRLPQLAAPHWPDDLPVPTRSEVLMLGALFRRREFTRVPNGCDEGVELGLWFELDEFNADEDINDWRRLDKPWWLSPAQVEHAPPLTASELAELSRPILVGRQVNNMCTRAFIVPTGWRAG